LWSAEDNFGELNLVTATRITQSDLDYKHLGGLDSAAGILRLAFNGYSDLTGAIWPERLMWPSAISPLRGARSSPLVPFLALAALLTVWFRPSPAWPAERIVSLAPSITETLFAIGAGPGLVGVSEYCDYPEAALKLPKVGSFLTPNLEAIVGLRPDLIIGLDTSSNDRVIRALERMGYRVLTVNDDSLEDISQSIQRIGQATGHESQATRLLDSMHARTQAVVERLKAAPPRKVLMVVGHDPLVAVGGGYLDQLLRMGDCVNIAAGLGAEWPRLSMEYIIARAPDVILDGQMGTDPKTPGGFWSRYPNIPAVRNHRVFGYDENPVLRPGPRVAETLDILASLTHPEAFGPQN
jgi:iron complex transport system substrate-binding protein